MNTYRIIEEWIEFQKFMAECLKYVDKTKFCFMHKDNEIYIRYSDDRIGEIIKIKYILIPSDAPDIFINDGWTFKGNLDLFTI